MKIENQVCSLEQAKRLKELGIEQENYSFKWMDEGSIPYLTDKFRGNWSNDPRMVVDVIGEYRAFTVAELLFMNHETITINTLQLASSAEALADHLIGRIERGDITIDEINARL